MSEENANAGISSDMAEIYGLNEIAESGNLQEPESKQTEQVPAGDATEKQETTEPEDDFSFFSEETEEELAKETEEKPEPKADNYEKRYRDVQSYADKQRSENEALKKELAEIKSMLNKPKQDTKQEVIEDDYTGEVPKKPTKEEWEIDPAAAYEKSEKYKEWKAEQERNRIEKENAEKKAIEENEKFKAQYTNIRTKAWNEAQKMFPELKDPNSRLFKLADKILKENPLMEYDPHCDLNAVIHAANKLGLSSSKKSNSKPSTNFIMKPGSSSLGVSRGISEDDFAKLSPTEREELMAKEYFKT